MLKKIVHITLSAVLLAATIGVAVSKHYCGDAMISVSLNDEATGCCEGGACCHNENHFFQLDVDLSVPPAVKIPVYSQLFIWGKTPDIFHRTFPQVYEFQPLPFYNGPPPLTPLQSLSLIQVFRL